MPTTKTYEHFEIEVPTPADPYTKVVRRHSLETAVRTYETALADRKEVGSSHLVILRKVTTELLVQGAAYKGPRPWDKPLPPANVKRIKGPALRKGE